MTKRSVLSAVLTMCCGAALADDAKPGELSLTKTIHIGGAGRWDYVSFDPAQKLLYVTRSTHVNVIDPATEKVVADIPGGEGLHGTAIATAAGRGFTTDGRAGKLLVFDLKTKKPLGAIDAADDADGITFDEGANLVLVSCGDAEAMLTLDPTADIATAKVRKIDLGGKPEFLAADGRGMAYVCINDKNEIAVVDLKAGTVAHRWPTGTGTAPTGLAIDAKNGRLFVGCRNQKLVILSTEDGKVLSELPIGRGNDACGFDAATGEAFASCGDSTLTVVTESTPGTFAVKQTVATKPGARTMTLDPATHTVYLPTAEMVPGEAGKRPQAKPDSFSILVVTAAH